MKTTETQRLNWMWKNFRQRCFNKKKHNYHRYGGRGITVCVEWSSFKPFLNWALKNGYRDDLQIDRKNNNGNYEPSNCRFVTPKEQARNRSTNKLTKEKAQEIIDLYSAGGITHREISKIYNVDRSMVGYIVNGRTWTK